MSEIAIRIGDLGFKAEIDDTPTGNAIVGSFPLEGTANRWGDEIYFDISLQLELEPDAREEVAVGDLAYWPAGPAFCIFFGKTPVSTSDTPRAFSPVNVFGRILGGTDLLRSVGSGESITVSAA